MMRRLAALLPGAVPRVCLPMQPAVVAQDGRPGCGSRSPRASSNPCPTRCLNFVAETPAAEQFATEIARVVADDLTGTGLFREIPRDAHIARHLSSFGAPVASSPTGRRSTRRRWSPAPCRPRAGRVKRVKFRVWDVFAGQELGQGMQFASDRSGWRRLAHKVADQVYSRLTGEQPYFDSRVVFVSETGPKDARQKRLAIMDYDGAPTCST